MASPNNHVGRAELEAKLTELGIETSTVEHPEVFTVEAMMPYLKDIEGACTKNLFLRDKKKKLWLFAAVHDKDVKLNELAKKVGAPGGLRFADEAILFEKLGVKQGCVTAFALINDKEGDVKFIIDDELINGKYAKIHFHPLSNAATTGISPQDFMKFVEATGHVAVAVKLDDEDAS